MSTSTPPQRGMTVVDAIDRIVGPYVANIGWASVFLTLSGPGYSWVQSLEIDWIGGNPVSTLLVTEAGLLIYLSMLYGLVWILTGINAFPSLCEFIVATLRTIGRVISWLYEEWRGRAYEQHEDYVCYPCYRRFNLRDCKHQSPSDAELRDLPEEWDISDFNVGPQIPRKRWGQF